MRHVDDAVDLGEPEVEHLHRAVGLDLDVARLEIAMDDALLVRGFERRRDLARDAQRLVERKSGRRARTLREQLGQRLAFDQLHHQVVGPDVVQRADVGMIQRRHRACFPLEALGEALGGDLDGHVAAEP